MKPKPNPLQHIRAVNYQYSSNGVVCHGRTIVASSTRAGLKSALRRFWQTNSHVQPEAA